MIAKFKMLSEKAIPSSVDNISPNPAYAESSTKCSQDDDDTDITYEHMSKLMGHYIYDQCTIPMIMPADYAWDLIIMHGIIELVDSKVEIFTISCADSTRFAFRRGGVKRLSL